MCKELTIISIFLLGLLADILWFGQTYEFGKLFLVQISLALFIMTFIVAIGKKFLSKYPSLNRRFSLVLPLRFDRLRFQPNLWKRQTSSTEV